MCEEFVPIVINATIIYLNLYTSLEDLLQWLMFNCTNGMVEPLNMQ
jgi:hypothetical protein